MPKLKDLENSDELYDPSLRRNSGVDMNAPTGSDPYVNAGQDQLDAHLRDSSTNGETASELRARESGFGDAQNNSNSQDSVKDQEENPYNFTPGSSSNKPQSFVGKAKGLLKKRWTPAGVIAGLLLGGLGGLTMLISPGLAVIQMKEILSDDLNDQFAAMDIRSNYVMRAKLKDMGTGICGPGAIKVKCGWKGMSKRQIDRFRAAGIEVETAKDKLRFGRNKVLSLTFRDQTSGKTFKVDNPRELNKVLGEKIVRDGMRRALNWKVMGFTDAVTDKIMGRFKTHKGDKLGTGSSDDMDRNINSAILGDPVGDPTKIPATDTDKEGNPTDKTKEANAAIDRQAESIGDSKPIGSLFSSVAKNGMKSLGKSIMITGAADTACTVKNTARAVEAGAKVYRMRQLISFAMVYLSFADSQKAGTATPEQAEYVGNKLTAIDTAKMVTNETSVLGDSGDIPKEVANPDYGKNAFDSQGYKVASYNEAPLLSARTMQYTIGGGAVMGTLSKVNDFIARHLDGNKCKYIQNTGVRIGSFILGAALGLVTFGAATAALAGVSLAIGMAIPILENYLAQMVAGQVVDSETEGVDAGNAIFAGTAGLMGTMAMSRGMKPATKSDLKSYLAVDQKVQNEYIAAETEAAKDTPFDINNRYSFLGSLSRTLLPLRTTSSISIGNSFSNLFNIMPMAGTALTTTTHAKNEYNEERFSRCKDYGYEELGIDADVFCNVRYVLSDRELALDTDQVVEWMFANGYVNENGDYQDEYVEWIEECVERERGWGTPDAGEENDGEGTECMNSRDLPDGKKSRWSDEKLSYFRVYTMDKSIWEAMDYEAPIGGIASTGNGTQLRISSFNIYGASHTDGPIKKDPTTPTSTWSSRIKYTLKTIKDNNLEVIGFQEFEPVQRKYLRDNLPNYGMSSVGKAGDSIMWNKDRFKLIKQGTWQTTYFGGPIQEPWVKLQDSSTGQAFYVMNAHDPINRGAGDAEARYQNALKHAATVKRLQGDAPVFLTGDFNSAYTRDVGAGAVTDEKLTYCVLTKNGFMNDAYDLSVPREAKCPNKPKGAPDYIDHIYLTPQIEVTSFKDVDKGFRINGSDHPTIFADAVIPGSGDDASTGTPGSDIVGDDYAKECNSLIGADQCTEQCVAFVKFRLVKHKVLTLNIIRNGLGNGKDVTSTLAILGFKVDKTPAVHSVFSTANTSTPQYGHTGVVSAVNADGSIVVEEYNYENPLAYGKRTISKAEYTRGVYTFAHTEKSYR